MQKKIINSIYIKITFLLLALYNILDYKFTNFILKSGGEEKNPVILFFMTNNFFFISKVIIAPILVCLIYYYRETLLSSKLGKIIYFSIFSFYTVLISYYSWLFSFYLYHYFKGFAITSPLHLVIEFSKILSRF